MKIGVIGAGVIGVTAALVLTQRGHQVTVLDREGVAAGASMGNAGGFAFPEVIPLATPGVMRNVPGWLLDPLGPLSIRPGYAAQITPWLLQFWRASRQDRYAAAIAAQAGLMEVSRSALSALIDDFDLSGLVRAEGQLALYQGPRGYGASQAKWDMRARHGVRFDPLEHPDAIADIQPGLSPRFTHARFTPDWSNVTDPAIWTRRIADEGRRLGVTFEVMDVRRLIPEGGGVRIAGEGDERQFDRVILSAGAWSAGIARSLGLRLPLETERGYNTTLPAGAFDMRTHLTFGEHGFTVSRIGAGVRVGGAVELGGLRLAPNMARADALLAKAADFLPGLDTSGGHQWMGFRPSLPDSLPVIGAAPGTPGVIMAFGHGHLGLTQSPGTARLIADLIDARSGGIDMAPYSPTRFRGGRA